MASFSALSKAIAIGKSLNKAFQISRILCTQKTQSCSYHKAILTDRLTCENRKYTGARYFSSTSISNENYTVHRISSRGLIRVAGLDAADFLQGLITNDVNLITASRTAMYAMLLNVQGRVMYDLIVYNISSDPGHPSFLVECDSSVIDNLGKDVRKYKIRKKVDIANVTNEYILTAVLSPDCNAAAELSLPDSDCIMVTRDPRVSQFGWRLITDASSGADLSNLGTIASEEDYHIRRYQWGISEGCVDLPPGNCFPLESNLVYLHGASFQKGCYIGQELTARTFHTGVTRKRIMPLKLEMPVKDITAGADIKTESGKPAGKYRQSFGRYGLGLMRLAEIKNKLVIKPESGSSYNLSASTPDWWPSDSLQ